MSVQRRDQGGKVRWLARYRGPDGVERSRTHDTRKAATTWLAERERELRRGEWIDPHAGDVRLEQVVTRWRDLAQTPGTRRVRQHLTDNLGEWGRYPVSSVKAAELRAWQHTLLTGRPWAGGAPLSPSTVRNLHGQLAGALALAVEDGHLLTVPTVKAAGERGGAVTKARLLTTDQVWTLIDAARDGRPRGGPDVGGNRAPARRGSPQLARMLYVAAGTGLRSGELCGLRVRNVAFLPRVAHVVEQAGPGTGMTWAPPKTAASVRDVALAESVVNALAAELADNPHHGDDSLPIFRTARGGMWTPTTVANVFARLARETGMPEWASFHSLRHYYASTLIFAGLSVPVVSQSLGHSSAATTLDVYSHLWPGDDDRARGAVEAELVREICGKPAPLVGAAN